METPRLLDQVRDAIRVRHYSLRTEESYLQWIKRFILFHNKRHPRDMGEQEITAFLTHLAVDKNVAASTQNQALAAILFLYKEVMGLELGWLDNVIRAKRSVRVPEVLSPEQVNRLLGQLDGIHQLVGRLLYGTGMRLMEAIRLRVQDVDFHYRQITVRNGKGNKDRVTVLPDSLIQSLKSHLVRVRELHKKDLAEGYGRVYLPFALAEKYPNAEREWPGNMFSRRRRARRIPELTKSAGITCASRICSVPSSRPRRISVFQPGCARTRFDTRLPRTCSRAVRTFAPYRSCSGIRM